MKRFSRFVVLALAALLLWTVTPEAVASRFRFANLSWKRAPGTNALAVEITAAEAWRLGARGIGEIYYYYGDGSGGFTTSTATRIATLADSAGEQFEVWRYTTTHTYRSNDVFRVDDSSCCRISTLVNAADPNESVAMLCWPGAVDGYELQTATSILGPWMPVTAPVAQDNGDNAVRLSGEGTRFYRLVQPT